MVQISGATVSDVVIQDSATPAQKLAIDADGAIATRVSDGTTIAQQQAVSATGAALTQSEANAGVDIGDVGIKAGAEVGIVPDHEAVTTVALTTTTDGQTVTLSPAAGNRLRILGAVWVASWDGLTVDGNSASLGLNTSALTIISHRLPTAALSDGSVVIPDPFKAGQYVEGATNEDLTQTGYYFSAGAVQARTMVSYKEVTP